MPRAVRVRPALLSVTVLAAALTACVPLPQRAGVGEWRPSPNYDTRRPNAIVLHHTGSDDLSRALASLTDPATGVSAHYVVGRDGRVFQLVDEAARAWHAGVSSWGGDTDVNSASIGIELVNDGRGEYPEPQVLALLALLRDVTTRQRIPPDHVLGHGDVAPGRKVDPGARFPWARLAAEGFGPWCDAALPGDTSPASSGPAATDDTEWVLLLKAIGYDVQDPGAALAAFHRHFRSSESTSLEPGDRSLLRCLATRKSAPGAR